ncbi:MAG TPA: sulfotransferase [Candidatus Binatia bacterium]|nr:sulfotransferase [Candidatus Binatia bacterium]
MALHVVGAGLGRTGTLSLKAALERLLGDPCYHMVEVLRHPEHIPAWRAAANGAMPDWTALLHEYRAAVDWPAASFWPELSEAFPDALVLLSVRDAESWWQSASQTIFPASRRMSGEWREMVDAIFASRFTLALDDRAACIEAFERHNALVRKTVPASRLLEWRPGDGWAPLCAALKVPVPDGPFPHTNSTEEFLARPAS